MKPFVVVTELLNSGTWALKEPDPHSPQLKNILTEAEGEITLPQCFGLKSMFLAWGRLCEVSMGQEAAFAIKC